MAIFKTNFFFRQNARGWTESVILEGSSIATILPRVGDLAAALAAPRDLSTTLTDARITQVDSPPPRPSQLKNFNLAGSQGTTATTAVEHADNVTNALFLRLTYSDGSSNPYMLRGMYDADLKRDLEGNALLTASLQGKLATLATVFLNAGANAIGRLRYHDNPHNPITGLARAVGQKGVKVTFAAAPGFSTGDLIRFKGLLPRKDFPWGKGLFRVIATAVATEYMIGVALDSDPPVPPALAVGIKVTYDVPTFVAFDIVDIRTRDTGRPTGVSRGRSSGIHWRR